MEIQKKKIFMSEIELEESHHSMKEHMDSSERLLPLEAPIEVIDNPKEKIKGWILKGIAVLFILGFAGVVIYMMVQPKMLERFLNWVKNDLGYWGMLVMISAFIVISFPVAVGYTILGLACGFIYGVVKGTIVVMIGGNLGANVAYWALVLLLKDWVEGWIQRNPLASALLLAVRNNAIKICLLLRFCPVPYGLQNALMATAGIQWRTFAWTTFLGTLPENVVWNYLGSTFGNLAAMLHGNKQFGLKEKIMLAVEITVTLILIAVLTYVGRRALKKAIEDSKQKENSSIQSNVQLQREIQQ